jgi:hypothetical protein
MSTFDIHKKNKKMIHCGTCDRECPKGTATKYYHDPYNKLHIFRHFVCKECYDRITCNGRLVYHL